MPTKTTEDILRDLVAMPTVSDDHAANSKALDYIEAFLQPYKLHIKRHVWNGVESLTATTRDTKTPTVFLAAHVDVVPGHPEDFRLRLENDTYTGRGVLDMKGPLAAFLSVIAELGATLPEYDLGLMVVTDEERGGMNGTAKLVEEGYIPKILVLPDGRDGWAIERVAKGFWHFNIEATGSSEHGSRPWQGDNAIDKLLAVIDEIKGLFPAEMNMNTNSVAVATIQGGHVFNQIPDQAIVGMDTRFISAIDQKQFKAAIQQIAANRNLKLTTVVEGSTVENDPTDPYFQAYVSSIETFTGKLPDWIISNGATDARFYAEQDTVIVVSHPPGSNSHGPNEWLSQASLGQMHDIFLDYLKKVALVPTEAPAPMAVR
jgi:succinyl-diaminopimelate desuccinylase